MRIKRGITKRKRHKKILAAAAGYRGGRSKLFKQAQEAVLHSGADAYRGRKLKKRDFRSLWIIRISAALSDHNLSYHQFISNLKKKNVQLNRKILSQLAIEDKKTFDFIVNSTKT